MKVVLLTGACLVCAGVLLAGCGRDVVLPDRLGGATVARMAERELEAQNPRLATGRVTCPDLRLRIGTSVRCLRTTELSGGRVVKVAGTVRVTSLAGGGRLHVVMDDRAEEFGLAGEHVATGVRDRLVRRFHLHPRRVSCPYLRGSVGTTVSCRVEVAGRQDRVEVEVSAVDPAGYRTRYTVRRPRAS